jgi:hypothetical protein
MCAEQHSSENDRNAWVGAASDDLAGGAVGPAGWLARRNRQSQKRDRSILAWQIKTIRGRNRLSAELLWQLQRQDHFDPRSE